jgi:hypothetical protein
LKLNPLYGVYAERGALSCCAAATTDSTDRKRCKVKHELRLETHPNPLTSTLYICFVQLQLKPTKTGRRLRL